MIYFPPCSVYALRSIFRRNVADPIKYSNGHSSTRVLILPIIRPIHLAVSNEGALGASSMQRSYCTEMYQYARESRI